MKHLFLLAPFVFILSACSYFDGEEEKPPLPGERISILDLQEELTPSADALEVPITIALADPNNNWAQAGRIAQNLTGNLEVSDINNLEQIWRADIGKGRTSRLPLTAQPVVANGQIYTSDTKSMVSAFDTQTGRLIWEKNVRPESEDESVIAGGLAVDGEQLIVSAGYNEVVSLSTSNGEIVWRTKTNAGSRAAPTVAANRVFIKTLDNSVLALSAREGIILWEYEGIGETTGLLGAAAPAVDEQLVVAPFSSGDVNALRVENGSVVWNERLVNTLQLSGLSALADIRGLPVIDNDSIYSVSYGGKIVAIDKATGLRRWAKDISSAETPLVIGDYIFLLASDNKLVALDKSSGNTLWVKSLRKYANQEKRKNPIFWSGPIMVSSQIAMISTTGVLSIFAPQDGTVTKQYFLDKTINIGPVVAEGTIFVLAADGSLMAYR